ncbi:DUF2690 domain-containing protein [Micromonospora sp. LOL_025]|uniref:DUF2690 domain-containing protein n=1 Tax=Micromonospora sp. LOL_025 TaxID=3345413 RepID=UPI003A8C37B8
MAADDPPGGEGGVVRHESDRQDHSDSIELFVEDLRRLRDELEVPPTWDAMVHRARNRGVRVSRSTLHKVAKLDGLPSELAVRGYLTALSRDPAEVERWVARRTALVALPGEQDAAEVTTRPPGRTRWRWWVAIAATLLVTNVVTGFVVRRISTPAPVTAPAATGDNPLDTPCLDDAKVATSTYRNQQFLLEIVFSVRCRAAWARITRADDSALGNHVEVVIYRRSDPDGSTRQEAVEPDVKSAFTTLIVRADPTDRLCASGAVVTNDTRSAAMEPICI